MKIAVSGYGGEVTLGSITKEQHVYWALQDDASEDINCMLFGFDDEMSEQHPEELLLPQFYEIDDIAHANGASFDSAYVTVENDDGEELWSGYLTALADSPDGEKLIAKEEEYYFSESNEKYGIYAYTSEKGTFAEIEVKNVNEFDPSRLRVYISDIEGDRIVDSIEYEDAECEDLGNYDTVGKGYDYNFVTNEDQ